MTIVTLNFNGVDLTTVDNGDNQIWVTSSELAKGLGYKTTDSVTRIYNRYSDEFTEKMSQTLIVTEPVNMESVENRGALTVKTRIFSLRGCHLLAMFARTQVAKDFRVWVLDLIEKEIASAQVQTVPVGYLQKLRDENRAKYALGFSIASEGGKTLSSWKQEKNTLDTELQVIDSLMQPLLTGFDEAKLVEGE